MIISADLPFTRAGDVAAATKAIIEALAASYAPRMREWQIPPLYRSGVRFRPEPNHGTGNEEFASPPRTYARKWGDCDDLVIYRLAELKAAGIRAHCRCIWVGTGLHVQVRLPNGKVEDPSIQLGAPVNWPKNHLWDL